MIIKLKGSATQEQIQELSRFFEDRSYKIHLSTGEEYTIMGLVGDTTKLDEDSIRSLEIVEDVKRIQEPYKEANKKFHPEQTVITLDNGVKIGGGHFAVMAGPCCVESREQILTIARSVKESGASILRGGAFKPRTSPYSFQGMGEEGIQLLLEAKKETGLPIVTEIMEASHLPYFKEVDILQVGARNMQNFELLKVLGRTHQAVLLKRGLANTYEELLMSAEYIMAGGNKRVILCERGIRTFEPSTRNTLDLAILPYMKSRTHLPVLIDPSHATGVASFVEPMALAATVAGADALMIEVHNDPEHAFSDGPQSLRPEAFAQTMRKIDALRTAMAHYTA